jgi:AraC-like DNA-binding protein
MIPVRQPQEFSFPEELREAIRTFWYNRIEFSERSSGFEVQPDGYAEIIFHFGDGCSVFYEGQWQPLPSPVLIGLLNQPVLLRATSRVEIIGIRCFPWSVFELLGLSAGKHGVQILRHPITELQGPLHKWLRAGKPAEAVAQLIQYFMQARAPIATDQLLVKAGGAMSAAHGTLPVSQVAAAAHATVRTLERKFKQAAGHTVKDVSGLMRFEQARNHLWRHPTASLAGLAQELGYTDQAHLSREFKRYSGTTPAAFARKAKSWQ